MVTLAAPSTTTPSPLAAAAVPAALVPMRLFSMTVPSPLAMTRTPAWERLPPMMLRSSAPGPPTRLLAESISTPSPLGSAPVPVRTLPRMKLLAPPEISIWSPSKLRTMMPWMTLLPPVS